MALHRTQVLLDPRQYRELTDLSRRERRSMSELVREAVDRELERRREEARDVDARWRAAEERARLLGDRVLGERGGERLPDTADMIRRMRDERDERVISNSILASD